MTTEAIYREIRECVTYRIEQEEKVANRARGLDYEQALARIEAYERVLEDLYASQASQSQAAHAPTCPQSCSYEVGSGESWDCTCAEESHA